VGRPDVRSFPDDTRRANREVEAFGMAESNLAEVPQRPEVGRRKLARNRRQNSLRLTAMEMIVRSPILCPCRNNCFVPSMEQHF
jgi:hypothetical protein